MIEVLETPIILAIELVPDFVLGHTMNTETQRTDILNERLAAILNEANFTVEYSEHRKTTPGQRISGAAPRNLLPPGAASRRKECATACSRGRLASSRFSLNSFLSLPLHGFGASAFACNAYCLARLRGEFIDGFLTVVAATVML